MTKLESNTEARLDGEGRPPSRATQRGRFRMTAEVVLAVATLASPAAKAVTISVGASGDASCTYHDLDLAIFAAAFSGESSEIRVARNQTYTNVALHLTSFPYTLTIRGGYDDCGDPMSIGQTTLNGRTNQPVVTIDGTTASDVHLLSLDLVIPTDGTTEVVRVAEAGRVLIDDGTITGGKAGGLTVHGAGASATLGNLALVEENEGPNGGGIVCGGSGAAFVGGRVRHNSASWNGGGMFAVESCEIVLLPGFLVQSNVAGTNGGGIYIAGGTELTVVASNTVELSLSFNEAGLLGGGIYAETLGTTAMLHDAVVIENTAGLSGGGLYAFDEALITTDHGAQGSCSSLPSGRRCTKLSNNQLSAGSAGSAAAAAAGGRITLRQTFVEGNFIARVGPGSSVLYAIGDGSQIIVESVQIWGNYGADTVFEAQGGGFVRSAFTTVGWNRWLDGGGVEREARGLILGSGGTGSVEASIFWPTAGFEAGPGGAQLTHVSCLIAQTTVGLPEAAAHVTVVDPQYEDLMAANLFPLPGSPAIDYCDATAYTPMSNDILYNVRGFDQPSNPNGQPGVPGGTYDVGAYEVVQIFGDGFESGDASHWSASAP